MFAILEHILIQMINIQTDVTGNEFLESARTILIEMALTKTFPTKNTASTNFSEKR